MKRMVVYLLVICLLSVPARAEKLAVDAGSCILMEKETGTILYAENEHEQLEPASVTKVMTLLLVMEAIDSGMLDYDDTVTASAHACSMGGSQIWLKENEQMSVEDMLKAVCVVSANDCSVALGEHLAGSHEAFVQQMNERAAALGMRDTHFVNCTGLPVEGHVTSAHDIAVMSRELVGNPDLCSKIEASHYVNGDFGLPTINDIINELKKPGRDPRESAEVFEFSHDIKTIEDLYPGMELPGIVTNITAFGAFVDIGIKQNGLIHASQMGVKGMADPSKVLKLHQQVKVAVISVDLDRGRIGLRLVK